MLDAEVRSAGKTEDISTPESCTVIPHLTALTAEASNGLMHEWDAKYLLSSDATLHDQQETQRRTGPTSSVRTVVPGTGHGSHQGPFSPEGTRGPAEALLRSQP